MTVRAGRDIDAAHRPWPPPTGPWVMAQIWHEVLFAHWPLAPETLRPLVPAALDLDTYEGQAWIGVVPFWMSGVRPRLTPALPGLSAFPELNLRTYVVAEGKPGVYFFSLDAGSWLGVEVARHWFHLPYYHARMSTRVVDGTVHYASERLDPRGAPARLLAEYHPSGAVFYPERGSLENWLVERYCLYTPPVGGRIYRGEILHHPWPLQSAEARFTANTMTAGLDLALSPEPPLLHFAHRLDVVVWPLETVKSGRSSRPGAPR